MKNKHIILTAVFSAPLVIVLAFLYSGNKQEVLTENGTVAVEKVEVTDMGIEQDTELGSTTAIETATEAATESEEVETPAPVVKPVAIEKEPVVVVDPAPVPEPVKPSGITMAEVRTHADASSCWSAINGLVYDLTSYIPKHPGGKGEILAICGKDGSSAFEGQHSGKSKPERILASYKIGNLSN